MPPRQQVKDWFEELFGFKENTSDWDATVAKFKMDGQMLVCDDAPQSHKSQYVGLFTCPSVADLQRMMDEEYSNVSHYDHITFNHEAIPSALGGIKAKILDPNSEGAVFQVASQFNCLEMANRSNTPKDGITIYKNDPTQGPACALACPAGTVYRNYLVKHGGASETDNTGQHPIQIDNMSDVSGLVDNATNNYWHMENGYLISTSDAIRNLTSRLNDEKFVKTLMNALRVGVHWETSVAPPQSHRVCQVYASAIPCTYKTNAPLNLPTLREWELFARLVLFAAYHATLSVATILSLRRKQRVKCYLTTLGFGAFGNKREWITDAIEEARITFQNVPLDVILVHYDTTIDKYWTSNLPKIPDDRQQRSSRMTSLARGRSPSHQIHPQRYSPSQQRQSPPRGRSQPLGNTRIPSTLLLLGTSLVRSLLQSTSEVEELQVSEIIKLKSDLAKLPSLKNKTAIDKLGKIDEIISNYINEPDKLQNLLLSKHKIGITKNSMFINTGTSTSTEAASHTITQEGFEAFLYKIHKLPIFRNKKDVKKILLQIDQTIDKDEAIRLLKEHFNIEITDARVSIIIP